MKEENDKEHHVEGQEKNREPSDYLHCAECGSRLIFKYRNNSFSAKCSNVKCKFKGKIDLQKKEIEIKNCNG